MSVCFFQSKIIITKIFAYLWPGTSVWKKIAQKFQKKHFVAFLKFFQKRS